jgi:hypothetical protein
LDERPFFNSEGERIRLTVLSIELSQALDEWVKAG